jgi:hypothetical protein
LTAQFGKYIFDELKLVATWAGLPTYYFQPELERWKRLKGRRNRCDVGMQNEPQFRHR